MTVHRLDPKLALEILTSLIFICTLVYLPEMDFQHLAVQLGLTDRFRIYTILICIAVIGIIIFRYSRVIGGYVFILLFYTMNTQMRYAELFTQQPVAKLFTQQPVVENTLDEFMDVINEPNTNVTNPSIDLLNLSSGDLSLAEDFILKQTESDPNKTQLEKNVVSDIIRQYFVKSNKLTMLRNFNDNALKANPVAGGPQQVVGIATGVV